MRVLLLTGAGGAPAPCCCAVAGAAHSKTEAKRPSRAVSRVTIGGATTRRRPEPLSLLVFRRRFVAVGRKNGLRAQGLAPKQPSALSRQSYLCQFSSGRQFAGGTVRQLARVEV